MDLLRRIRWINVARALAVAAVIALLAAWPHLRGDGPALPPEPALASTEPPPATAARAPAEEPAIEFEPAPRPEPARKRRAREGTRRRAEGSRRARKGRGAGRPKRERPAVRRDTGGVAAPAEPPQPNARRTPPRWVAPAPAGRAPEFGIE